MYYRKTKVLFRKIKLDFLIRLVWNSFLFGYLYIWCYLSLIVIRFLFQYKIRSFTAFDNYISIDPCYDHVSLNGWNCVRNVFDSIAAQTSLCKNKMSFFIHVENELSTISLILIFYFILLMHAVCTVSLHFLSFTPSCLG